MPTARSRGIKQSLQLQGLHACVPYCNVLLLNNLMAMDASLRDASMIMELSASYVCILAESCSACHTSQDIAASKKLEQMLWQAICSQAVPAYYRLHAETHVDALLGVFGFDGGLTAQQKSWRHCRKQSSWTDIFVGACKAQN